MIKAMELHQTLIPSKLKKKGLVHETSIIIITIIIAQLSDLQPSTAISYQLPGQLVSTQIRTKGSDVNLNIFFLKIRIRKWHNCGANCRQLENQFFRLNSNY